MKTNFTLLKLTSAAVLLTCLGKTALSMPLEQALRQAMTQHPSVQSRQKELEATKHRVEGAERQRLPNLVLQSGQDYLGNRTNTYRVEQNLWTGGRITGEIDAAKASVRSAQSNLQVASHEILARVIQSYTELGRVRARIEVARANVTEHERLADLIARRVGGEVSPTSDGVMGLARLAQARAELSLLMSQETRARSTLSQAVGQDVDRVVVPAQINLPIQDFGTLMVKALDYSPALQRLANEERVLEADVRVKASANWPQLKLRLDKVDGGLMANQQNYLAVEYQSGAGFAAVAQVREASSKLAALSISRETARRDLTDQISGDWADLQSFRLQQQDLKAQVNTTTEVFDSFVRQYAVGRKTWIDVLNSQRDLTLARNSMADVEWGTTRSILRLQLATGTLSVLTDQ
jgi:adhesin transport system outer membrane protein